MELKNTPEKLYIEARVHSESHTATAIIAKEHTHVIFLSKDGITLDLPKDKADCEGSEELDPEVYAVSWTGFLSSSGPPISPAFSFFWKVR